MKPYNSSTAVWKTLAVAISLLALVGVTGNVQAASLANQITAHDQDITSGVVVLDSVTASQDGWVALYKNPNFTIGEIVGYAPVHQGINTNVKVTIDAAKVGQAPTLWARLHVDSGVPGLFEWGLRNLPYDDAPVVQSGQFVVVGFGTAAAQAAASTAPVAPAAPAPSAPVAPQAPVSALPAGSANPIVVKNQDLNTGVIVFDSITAAQDGWIVVYKNPNFTIGEIVGYAPVHQGINSNVRVTIDTTKVGNLPTLWARLHVDNGVPGLFEWGLRNLPYDDAPVFENGHYVMAEFGTWATQ